MALDHLRNRSKETRTCKSVKKDCQAFTAVYGRAKENSKDKQDDKSSSARRMRPCCVAVSVIRRGCHWQQLFDLFLLGPQEYGFRCSSAMPDALKCIVTHHACRSNHFPVLYPVAFTIPYHTIRAMGVLPSTQPYQFVVAPRQTRHTKLQLLPHRADTCSRRIAAHGFERGKRGAPDKNPHSDS